MISVSSPDWKIHCDDSLFSTSSCARKRNKVKMPWSIPLFALLLSRESYYGYPFCSWKREEGWWEVQDCIISVLSGAYLRHKVRL